MHCPWKYKLRRGQICINNFIYLLNYGQVLIKRGISTLCLVELSFLAFWPVWCSTFRMYFLPATVFYSLQYFFYSIYSFTLDNFVPIWSRCDNEWNTLGCTTVGDIIDYIKHDNKSWISIVSGVHNFTLLGFFFVCNPTKLGFIGIQTP